MFLVHDVSLRLGEWSTAASLRIGAELLDDLDRGFINLVGSGSYGPRRRPLTSLSRHGSACSVEGAPAAASAARRARSPRELPHD
jgi:hypothetical protein